METYNIHDAKTNLSRLIEETVRNGEPFVIAKAGKPMVKVVRIDADPAVKPRRVGFMTGRIAVPDDFDAMDSQQIAQSFDGTDA